MHEILKYEWIKGHLAKEDILWRRVFDTIEEIIDVDDIDDVVITYTKNIFAEDPHGTSIYIFTKEFIYVILTKTNGKEFEIKTLKPVNISEINLKVDSEGNTALTIAVNNEKIVLSSKEDAGKYSSQGYADGIIDIAKLYSR